jgi:cell division protease FtsH
MEDTLASMLGGQAAEEIVFNELTTGASDDLEKATEMARSMVTRYGMSRKLGSRTYGKKEELIFLGRDIQETRNYSDETAHAIDQEVSGILSHAHHRAKEILTKHRAKLEEIAERLIREETLDEETFSSMFDVPYEHAETPSTDGKAVAAAGVAGVAAAAQAHVA